jgi:hypothetical protein
MKVLIVLSIVTLKVDLSNPKRLNSAPVPLRKRVKG